MTVVLLVRHGHTDWVKKKRLAGWTPGIPLNKKGRRQAERLAQALAHLPIRAVYTSPLERCLETAEAVAGLHGLAPAPLPAVGEVRYGDWEGVKLSQLAKDKAAWRAVQHYPSRFRFPNGETLAEVQARAVEALEALAGQHREELVVVCSHADVIKLVLAHYLGLHLDLFQRLHIGLASLSALALGPAGQAAVLRVNDDGPFQLPDPAAAKKKKPGGRKKA
ncbi:MAG: MSMEG_4193 family putative phosphomutase, partial [Candidatus Promineifilaceae bacterium]